ncbi:STAS domain-containing protein [Streptomyces sp. NPDC014894]|uniref:STAS domain-containing protein n=1 Tax=Streptomyces sp. NPDC014894 TaxID=3364931 RepID=UPI0036F630D3
MTAAAPRPILSHRTEFRACPGGGERAVIRLVGELDLDSGALVADVVELCLSCRPVGVRVDVSGLTLMDCAGLGRLHGAARAVAAAGADFALVGDPQPLVRRVLDLTGTSLGTLAEPPSPTAVPLEPGPAHTG